MKGNRKILVILILSFLLLGSISLLLDNFKRSETLEMIGGYSLVLCFITFLALLLTFIFYPKEKSSSQHINIATGTGNIQTTNSGDSSNLNVAHGNEINQSIKLDMENKLATFILDLKQKLDNFSIASDEKQDIISEISRVEVQLGREKPKYPIINQSLKIIRDIIVGAAGNILGNSFTSSTIDTLTQFIRKFN